ncbi:hypothetical protein [Chitinimonas naiadis]
MRSTYPYLGALAVTLLLFAGANRQVTQLKRDRIETEMQLALPTVVQLVVAGGDRHLAANIGAFRAVTAGVFQLKPETYQVLADVQLSAAQLNPYHEDNYYTAAAILAWNDQLDAAQEVLRLATEARTKDALPPFFHGFNRYYFYSDFKGAGDDLMRAAERSEGMNRTALQAIANKWFSRGQNPKVAIDLLQRMVAQSKNEQFSALLNKRIGRLQGLVVLQEAISRFKQQSGRGPAKLDELVKAGVLAALPVDPIGLGYVLDASGEVVLAQPVRKEG